MATDYRTILVKRGSADDWAASVTPLQSGEWGLDQTNGVAKMGDGLNLWADLPMAVQASTTGQLPDEVRSALAANLADPSTPEGAAVVASGGGGGSPAFTNLFGGSPSDVAARSGVTPPDPVDENLNGGTATTTDSGTAVHGGTATSTDAGTAYNDGSATS